MIRLALATLLLCGTAQAQTPTVPTITLGRSVYPSDFAAMSASKQDYSARGQPNGYAPTDANNLIPWMHLRTFNVLKYGAAAGSTLSGAANVTAFNAAFAACYTAGGGEVRVPSVGAAFHLATGLSLTGNACSLVGDRIPNWPGPVGTEAQWTTYGSWIACDDNTKPCIQFLGSGVVNGINFWRTQPTPSATAGTAWAPADVAAGTDPTAWPWTVMFRQNFSWARNIQIANSSYGITFEYPDNANIAGTYSGLENIYAGCFRVCIRFKSVNDTMSGRNIHVRGLWNIDNSNVVTYMETNLVGMHMQYLDNMQIHGLEFYKTAAAIRLTDGNAVYSTGTLTHAAENVQLSDVQFNQVVQAVTMDTGTTMASIQFNGARGQSDTDTNRAAGYFFNFASDYADMSFSNLEISAVGNSLMGVGAGGTGARVTINGLTIRSPLQPGSPAISGYGYFAVGSAAFYLAKNSKLSIPTGVQNVVAASGAGPMTACMTPIAGAGSNCGSVVANVPATTPTSP